MFCWSATARSIARNGTLWALARLADEAICCPSWAITITASTLAGLDEVLDLRSLLLRVLVGDAEDHLVPCRLGRLSIADFSAWRIALSRSKLTPMVCFLAAVDPADRTLGTAAGERE